MTNRQATPSIENVVQLYEDAYKEHGHSVNSLLMPKGRQKERFDALTSVIIQDNFSILDYGCGFGHLKEYLDQKFKNFSYTGVDIVPSFIEENSQRFKESANTEFQQIQSYKDVTKEYDYILCAGTFNCKYSEDFETNKQFVHDAITHLFGKTRVALLLDFMPTDVDFMYETAYHQDVMEIYEFARKNLSRRLKLDLSYMPYEYAVMVYKNSDILRPDNIYQG